MEFEYGFEHLKKDFERRFKNKFLSCEFSIGDDALYGEIKELIWSNREKDSNVFVLDIKINRDEFDTAKVMGIKHFILYYLEECERNFQEIFISMK
ncbi:hypothetical protein [Draconibacterium mangrovi]|uniref:hypothetical protein n=1 Tax=Draconibacterium mangrovi TaxID=2697469 RepID=UPI0013D5D6B3|nr:hypothetical protein [Draconibacterium mangrovi]